MRKIWYSSKELMIINGLPSTIQGINRKARVEKWRRRQRLGVQGRAVEYHIDSLPAEVKNRLTKSNSAQRGEQSLIEVWISAYLLLTAQEQRYLINWILREGVQSLLSFITIAEQEKHH